MLHVERSYSSGILSVPGARCLWRGRSGQSHPSFKLTHFHEEPSGSAVFTGRGLGLEEVQEKEVTEQHYSPLNPSSGIPTVDRENTVSTAEQARGRDSSDTHPDTRRPWRRSLTLAHPPVGKQKNWRQFKALVYVCWPVQALLLWPSGRWCSRGPRPGCPEWPSRPSDLCHR